MLRRILTVTLAATALLTIPATAYADGTRDWASPDQGAVLYKWHRIARPTVAGIEGNPECWGLLLSQARKRVCVDEATWEAHPVGTWYAP